MSALLKRALADGLRQFPGMKTKRAGRRPARAASRLWQVQENDRRKLIRRAACARRGRAGAARRGSARASLHDADETALRRRPPRPRRPQSSSRYSGGRDSAALLHVLTRLRASAARAARGHRGACPSWPETAADEWLAHCEAYASPARCAFIARQGRRAGAGRGLEAAARAVRYAGARRGPSEAGAEFVCCAHHHDDRIETFLIQWMRGAGPDGLAAFPAARAFADGGRCCCGRSSTFHAARSSATCDGSALEYVEDTATTIRHCCATQCGSRDAAARRDAAGLSRGGRAFGRTRRRGGRSVARRRRRRPRGVQQGAPEACCGWTRCRAAAGPAGLVHCAPGSRARASKRRRARDLLEAAAAGARRARRCTAAAARRRQARCGAIADCCC